MSDFRKLLLAFAAVTLFAGLASSHVTPPIIFWFIFGTFIWLLGSWILTECYDRFIRDKSKKRQHEDDAIVGLVAAFWPFSLPFLALAWLAWKTCQLLLDWGEGIVRDFLKGRTKGTQ